MRKVIKKPWPVPQRRLGGETALAGDLQHRRRRRRRAGQGARSETLPQRPRTPRAEDKWSPTERRHSNNSAWSTPTASNAICSQHTTTRRIRRATYTENLTGSPGGQPQHPSRHVPRCAQAHPRWYATSTSLTSATDTFCRFGEFRTVGRRARGIRGGVLDALRRQWPDRRHRFIHAGRQRSCHRSGAIADARGDIEQERTRSH